MYTYEKLLIDGRIVWYRWTTTKGPDWDRAIAASETDISLNANLSHYIDTGGAQYDAACGYCWLHASHTSDIHEIKRLKNLTGHRG